MMYFFSGGVGTNLCCHTYTDYILRPNGSLCTEQLASSEECRKIPDSKKNENEGTCGGKAEMLQPEVEL